jgi:hypothetical protein
MPFAMKWQHADDLGRERLVQDLHDDLGVGAIALGDGAALDVLAGAPAQGLDVGEKRLLLVGLGLLHGALLRHAGQMLCWSANRPL